MECVSTTTPGHMHCVAKAKHPLPKVINSQLCNKISDQWLNNRHITYIERNVFLKSNNAIILGHFQ